MNQLSLPNRLRPLLTAGVLYFALSPVFAAEISRIPQTSSLAAAILDSGESPIVDACLSEPEQSAFVTRLTRSLAQLEPGFVPLDDFEDGDSRTRERTATTTAPPPVRTLAAQTDSAKPSGPAATSSQSYLANIPRELSEKARALSAHIVSKFRVDPAHANHVVSSAMQTAARTGLPPTLLLAVIAVESGFNAAAKNSGALGLMQIIPFWHKDKVKAIGGPAALMKVDQNIAAGSAILKEYIDRSGGVLQGLVRYNASTRAKEYSEKVLKQKNGFEAITAN